MAGSTPQGEPADQTQPAFSLLHAAGDVAATLRDDVERGIEDLMAYLASPRGKELRSKLAMGVITVAPLIARSPAVRRNPVMRVLGVAGAATVLIKVAEAIRDWDPQPDRG
ncbi:MAG: hypothetical protein ACRDJ1_10230 [Actinomycetota bacterium]